MTAIRRLQAAIAMVHLDVDDNEQDLLNHISCNLATLEQEDETSLDANALFDQLSTNFLSSLPQSVLIEEFDQNKPDFTPHQPDLCTIMVENMEQYYRYANAITSVSKTIADVLKQIGNADNPLPKNTVGNASSPLNLFGKTAPLPLPPYFVKQISMSRGSTANNVSTNSSERITPTGKPR